MSAILLLVLSSDATPDSASGRALDGASSAMAASTADGRGGRAQVELDRVRALPSDDEALRLASSAKATTVVEVSWPDADGRRAHLHAHFATSTAWVDRDVRFEASSPAWERGRAVGLAIASMMPEEATPAPSAPTTPVVAPTPTPTPETPATARTTPPPATAATTGPPASPPTPTTDARTVPTTTATSPTTATPRPSSRDDVPPRNGDLGARLDFGLFGELGSSFGAQSAGFGGRIDATWWPSSRVGIRIGGGDNGASLSDQSVRVFDGDLGVAILMVGGEKRSSLVLRGDARLVRDEVSRSIDGASQRLGHTLPGLAIFAEGSVPIVSGLVGVVAIGGTAALGTTTLSLDGQRLADLPPFALVGQLGVRWTLR